MLPISGVEALLASSARAAGTTLGEFLRERIFAPLGMEDTAFSVPQAKLYRLATSYAGDQATQELKVFETESLRRSRNRQILDPAGF